MGAIFLNIFLHVFEVEIRIQYNDSTPDIINIDRYYH